MKTVPPGCPRCPTPPAPPERMHEYSVTESMLSLALEKAGEHNAAKITRIDIVLGDMSGIVGDMSNEGLKFQ